MKNQQKNNTEEEFDINKYELDEEDIEGYDLDFDIEELDPEITRELREQKRVFDVKMINIPKGFEVYGSATEEERKEWARAVRRRRGTDQTEKRW